MTARMMSTVVTGALVAIVAAACDGGPSEPEAPPRPNVSGVWEAEYGGATFEMTLVHDTLQNTLAGTGLLVVPDETLALVITGTYTGSRVTTTWTTSGFHPLNFSGEHAGSLIAGTLNGSGFQNVAVTFGKR